LKRTISRSRPDYSGRRQTMTQAGHTRTYSTLCQGIMPFTSYERVESKSNQLKDFVALQRNLENVKANSYHAIKRGEYESFSDRNPPVINIIRNGRLRVQYL